MPSREGHSRAEQRQLARRAREADEAKRRFEENCTGAVWEIWTARLFGISSLFCLGTWKELHQRVTAHLTEAPPPRSDLGDPDALLRILTPGLPRP